MSSLHQKKRFGAILRVWSARPEDVQGNVEQVVEAARAAEALSIDGQKVFRKVLVLVAADPAFIDHDCGQTLAALRKAVPFKSKNVIHAQAVDKGDLFCGVLNRGIGTLAVAGIDYAMVLSHGAKEYLRPDTLEQMMEALKAGARVTGIAIKELKQSVLEGRIANTFAIWNVQSLIDVGLFDRRAAQPRIDDLTANYVRSWNNEHGFNYYYPRAGVEEILPLIQLVRDHDECIAPIVPRGEAKWQAPDRLKDSQGYDRHVNKMETKYRRQFGFADKESCDLDFIKGGVMEQYRSPDLSWA